MPVHVSGVRHAFFVVLAFSLLATDAVAEGWSMEHALRYSVDDFELTRTVDGWDISSPSGNRLGLADAPRLPLESMHLVIPQGMRVRSVELRDAEWMPLTSGSVVTEGDILSSDGDPASREFDRFGFDDSRRPESTVLRGSNGRLDGYSLGSIEVLPVRETVGGEIEFLASAVVVLELEVDPRDRVQRIVDWPGQRETSRRLVETIVANPGDVIRHEPALGKLPAEITQVRPGDGFARTERAEARQIDLLIITSEELRTSYQPLADRRQAEGLSSVIVSLAEVFATATPGADQQETIRNYIRDAWATWGAGYVLLGGDAELIAPRFGRSTYYPAASFTDIPSDLYYAALDGTWNADGNGVPGQETDDVDLLAEISIGRAPLDTPAEVVAWVDKILSYEEPANPTFLGAALFLSEVLFPPDWTLGGGQLISLDGASYSEDLVLDQIIGGGNLMQSWRMYQNDLAYPGAIPETKTAALDSMNSGHFGLVNHIGHGFYYNMSVADANIFADDANNLTNTNPFFIHALNCSSGAFDVDSLLERFLQNKNGGAVGSAGSSRAAFPYWSSFYQTGFFDEVFVQKNTRIGDAQRVTRAVFAVSTQFEGGHRWTHLSYHLFGDPTMRMWVQEPRVPSIVHATTIMLGEANLSVSVSVAGGAAGAVVALNDAQGHVTSAVVDGGGNALVDLAGMSNEPGALSLVVSGANLERYSATVSVVSAGAGHLRAEALTLDDDAVAPSAGDGDGSADSGETVQWSFRFINAGGGPSVGAGTATLLSVDAPGAVILSDTAPVGVVANGGFNDAPAFVIQLDPTIPDGTLLQFTVETTDGVDTWTDPAQLVVRSPKLLVSRLSVDDSAMGNGDGLVDPGEVFDLVVEVSNRGEANLVGLVATVSSADPAVSIVDGNGAWPELLADDRAANLDAITLTEFETTAEHFSEILFMDAQGHQWTHRFELRAPAPPGTPTADTSLGPDSIVLRMPVANEPHFAGYRVYRRPFGGTAFVEVNQDPSILTGLLVDSGLPELTRFEYQVTLVDSSAIESMPTPVVSASTAPGELSPGFPISIGRELAGAVAVGDLRGNGTRVVTFGADWIYAFDSGGQELVDGDNDAQTLGPLGGDPANMSFSPSGVTLADLDGDGADEVIGSNWDSREIWVLRGDGSNFPGWPRLMNANSWAAPAVGDIDNNGDLEIVVNNTSGRTFVWNHDGSDFFDGDSNPATVGVFHVRSGETFNRSTPALFDVDNDGTLEIIFGTHYRNGLSDNFVHALRNDATNAPGWGKNTGVPGYTVGHVTIGDLDQDGTAEIILLTEDNLLNIWEPDGSVFGTAPYTVVSNAAAKDSRAPAAALADFDFDGDLEMVVVSILDRKNCEIMIMEHDGTVWPGWPRLLPGLSESSPVLGDIDGDSLIDIVFGIGGGTDGVPDVLYAMSPDGGDVAGFPISLAGAVRAVPVITDFDFDGDVDVVYAGFDRLVHVWDMPFPYNEALVPWPTFQADAQRTGVYSAPVATAVLSADIQLSATPNGVRIMASFAGALPQDFRFSLERSPAGLDDWSEVGTGLTALGATLIHVDESALAGASYEYRLLGAEGGIEFRSGVIVVPALRAAIHAAEPNPFNPRTVIRFEVPGTAGGLVPTRLEVFDLQGRLVRQIHVGPLTPGPHALEWDGVDGQGRGVASGVYLAVLRCAGEQRSLKMSLVK
jgi:hypothetical protein